jgi:hypothetical protein
LRGRSGVASRRWSTTSAAAWCAARRSSNAGICSSRGTTCSPRCTRNGSRASHLAVIQGANHNYFNRSWTTADGTPTISRDSQEELANHFATTFFSAYLMRQQGYLEILSGKSAHPTYAVVVTSDQPRRVMNLPIDTAENEPHTELVNSLGLPNVVSDGATLVEESLRFHRDSMPIEGTEEVEYGDTNTYYQDTRGMRVTWSNTMGKITVNVGDLDVSGFEYLGMRVGQRFRPTANLNLPGFQDFGIALRDTGGVMSAKVEMDATAQAIRPPDDVGLFTKSTMQSVRLSLRELATQVDLRHLAAIELRFDVPKFTGEEVVPSQGELIFDDLEFYGQERTTPEQP